MNVKIKSLVSGACEATGNVVIIDVLRATSTICTAIANGATLVMPVRTPEEAIQIYRTKSQHGTWKLITDNKSLIDMGFYDNSPSMISKMDIKNNNIILITTNGTNGIINCKKSDEIFIGSFLNSRALSNYLKKSDVDVTLVPMGNKENKSVEDELCARYLKDIMEGKELHEETIKERVINTEWAKILSETGRKDDVKHCVEFNIYETVPVFKNGVIKDVRKCI